MSAIQPSETRRVTTCWGAGIKMLLQWTTNTKISLGLPKRGSMLLNLVIWEEEVKVQKVKRPLSIDTSVRKYFLSLRLHLVVWVTRVSGTVEIQTQPACTTLESEQRFNRSPLHQRGSQSPFMKIKNLERLMFSKHAWKYVQQTLSIADHTGLKCLVWTSSSAKSKTVLGDLELLVKILGHGFNHVYLSKSG